MTDDRRTFIKPDGTRGAEQAHHSQERNRMNEGCFFELRAMFTDEFTGRITLHVDKGSVKKVDTHKTWRPRVRGAGWR